MRGRDRSKDGKDGKDGKDLVARVEAVRTALDIGGEHLDPAAVERARTVLTRADDRLRLGVEHTVVALAGATGSGKSSLFNALAGLDLARVGARRPTTSAPAACIWGGGADALLDWLDVPTRHRTARVSELDDGREQELEGLVLLDLPDHDSTQVAHRLEVDRLVGLVDLLVWVVDPQKYADEVLHRDYLQQLKGHDDVMLVVLNQVDRLPPGVLHDVRGDLERLLADDGLPAVPVLATSARTGEGVIELRARMGRAVQARDAAVRRLSADLDEVAEDLAGGLADGETDPARLPGERDLVTALAGAAGVPAVLDAVEGDYRRQAKRSVGWPFTRWSRAFRPDPLRRLRLGESAGEVRRLARSSIPEASPAQRAQVELASRRVAESAGEGLPERWVDGVRRAASPGGDDLADALDQAVARVPLERRRPVWWRVLGALQVVLAVAAVLGALWLLALFTVDWLRLPEPPTPELEGIPWPTVLLVGGLVLGLVLALLGGRLARWGARRRRRRTESRLRDAIQAVGRERVLDPVSAVLDAHRRTRRALGKGR